MIKVCVAGAGGRMGGAICHQVTSEGDMQLVSALEKAGHASVGQEVSLPQETRVRVTDDLREALDPADVLVDFTTPEATLAHVQEAASLGKKVVVGTTGFTGEQRSQLERAAKRVPSVIAPNMSLGIGVLCELLQYAVKSLGPEYDVEIVESHHRMKKDAPSGTALRLAEVAAKAAGKESDRAVVHGRGPGSGPRQSGQIAIHAVRGGDIVGEHTIILAGPAERVELTHRARSREVFTRGTVRAIRFVMASPPGIYTMADVIKAAVT